MTTTSTRSNDARTTARGTGRLLDRIFLAGCTTLYLGLVAAVIAALRMVNG